MTAHYDSAADTLRHIAQVRDVITGCIITLLHRASLHDQSKLREPEKSTFDRVLPLLKTLTYGSVEYRASLDDMGPALTHHYEANTHHPEHYKNGVTGMDLFDVLEMAADWVAASRRSAAGDNPPRVNIEMNVKRFGIEPQLAAILERTVRQLETFPTAGQP